MVTRDGGIREQVATFDAAGGVQSLAADVRFVSVLPFSSPVVDWAPTLSSGGEPLHSAIVAGGEIEILTQGRRYSFHNSEGFTSIAAGCLASELPATTPIPCFASPRSQDVGEVWLEQDSTIGPLTRVEWNALKNMDRFLLAGWERAGGPRDDAAVLQIAGAWGKSDGDSDAAIRPALVCGVLADNTVACWGTSQFYELGDGVRSSEFRYVRVPGLTDVAEVAVGRSFVCARKTDGHVACWGDASVGAFPLPKHPSGSSVPGCRIDEAATERTYRERVARARRAADACMRRTCAEGTLDCHLGCTFRDPPREPIYAQDRSCTKTTVFSRPQLLDVSDVLSIGAGYATVCFVYAKGYSSCGGG